MIPGAWPFDGARAHTVWLVNFDALGLPTVMLAGGASGALGHAKLGDAPVVGVNKEDREALGTTVAVGVSQEGQVDRTSDGVFS